MPILQIREQQIKQNYKVQTIIIGNKMRALMKGKAAQFFKKKEKAVEDPEAIMNEIQAKAVGSYIGIDEQEIAQFQGFFEQVAKIKLPKGYSRYPNSAKTQIHYINQLTGDQDTVHPSIDIIKMAFYKMLADSTSIATFNTKTNKLLPFVEDKMIKQCIGLSSKRREAEKTNLQRDENGKIVMSKLARLKPDLKALISTRSYMLKALVQKIYTKKELWGKGKKASVYAAILAAERGNAKNIDQGDQQVQQNEDSLQFYEKIYTQAKQFYQKTFGNLDYIPESLQKTKSFYRSTPESVLRNLGILNIEKTRMQLYWLARLMECLPLPTGWSTKIGDTFDKFFYEPKKLLFDLHPSYIYVLEQMNNFKLAYQEMDIIHQNYYNNMKEMVFYDYFERPYNVDLYAFVEKMSEAPMTKKKALKKSNELGRNDWMALEGIKNSDMGTENAVLIEDILEYWAGLNCKEDNYVPAISPFGEVVWSSTINERTINYCPHSEILKTMIENKAYFMPKIEPDTDLKKLEEKKDLKQLVYSILPDERENFLQHYIRHDPKPLSQPYQVPKNFIEYEFYNSIFIGQFNLESELNLVPGETPLWLEKVHAKQNSDMYFALLSKYPQKFEQVKHQFTKYSMEMIQKHEPSREQDIARVISEIKSVKQLKNFINHINDIDSREERKRLAAIGVVEEEGDSLGSSLSQIEMEDDKEESEESEDELINVDVEHSQSEGQKQESAQSDEDNINIKTEEDKRIDQVSEEQSIEEPKRIPQKYQGVVYQQSRQIDSLPQSQLNSKLLLLKKQKILKHKYSRSTIKETVEKLSSQLLKSQPPSLQLTKRKQNALISRFESEHAPYKVSPDRIRRKDRPIGTAMNAGNISQQFEPFKSECSLLGNDQITDEMREAQQRRAREREAALNESKEQKNVDDTKETIELMPIKRIKPDINEDPRLMHISRFGDLQEFSKTFNNSPSPTKLKALKNVKTKNLLQDTSATTKFNPESSIQSLVLGPGNKADIRSNQWNKIDITKQKLIERQEEQHSGHGVLGLHSTSLKKSQSVLSLSNNSSISPTKFNSKFNRVCMGNTATSLLSTEPLTRKGDLLVLEARKSLVSKGRGLETFLSRKY